MFGLVVIEVMTPSGHLSNINEISNLKIKRPFEFKDDGVKSRELQELVRFSCEYANKGTLTNKLVVFLLHISSKKPKI